MKPIYVVGSGPVDPLPFYHQYFEKNAFIIAVDGGANLLNQLKIVPNLAMGDFDSITKVTDSWLLKNQVERIVFPREKDFSDFELVCQKIISSFSPSPVKLFCMQGGRSDHFLFNLIVAEELFNHGFIPMFQSYLEDIYFINQNNPAKLIGTVGDIVSLIPTQNSVLIHQTIGLKYCLWDEELTKFITRGLSNEIIQTDVYVSVKEGTALLILNRRG